MKKRMFLACMVLMLLLCMPFITAMAEGDITIYVNEQILDCPVAPFIENERTMVPMRKIFEALDAEVAWQGDTQTIIAVKDERSVVLQIGNTSLYKDGEEAQMDVAPKIVSDYTFVPLRAVAQSLDAAVEWFGATRSVYINSPAAYETAQYAHSEITMYAADGRTITVHGYEVEDYKNVGWYLEPFIMVYAADGRSLAVVESEVEAYRQVGWYREPFITMYALDGRTTPVLVSEVEAYESVGWYLEPVIAMYALNGETTVVPVSEIEIYESVGWYLEPMTTMYAADGRTVTVQESEVYAYQSVGWYKTKAEAQAAAQAAQRKKAQAQQAQVQQQTTVQSAPKASSTSSSSQTANNRPNSGGKDVYRTPTGERYHFDPDCGGKNSYPTTLQGAKESGLTPCAKCAY